MITGECPGSSTMVSPCPISSCAPLVAVSIVLDMAGEGTTDEHHVDLNRVVVDDGIRIGVGLIVKLSEEPLGGRQLVQDSHKGVANMLEKGRVATVQLAIASAASSGNPKRSDSEGNGK